MPLIRVARQNPGIAAKPPRMRRRRTQNPRIVKIHRSYTVAEVADLFRMHKNTVRAWIKAGLPVIDDKRPALIQGLDLREFVQARRLKNRQTCPPGHIYCVRCRAPKAPGCDMVEYVPMTDTTGNLRGICPDCETLIHRRVSRTKIDLIRGQLNITIPEAESRISDRNSPTVNSDFVTRG
jgi:hypothetical protein